MRTISRPAFAALIASAALGSVLAVPARSAVQLNEIFTNPPGTDDAQEFIEFRSTTGAAESLAGMTLVIVEGESAAGVIDAAIDLSAYSTGPNGLLLLQANAAVSSIVPNPAPATSVVTADFAPDLENGSQTYLIVTGFSGAVGNDLDTDNNGSLDAAPWTSVVDAVGVIDVDAGEFAYAGQFGFTDFGAAPEGFDIEALFRLGTAAGPWVNADIGGTNPGGPYTFNVGETRYADGSLLDPSTLTDNRITPGGANPTVVVPEPTGLAALALAGLALTGRRRAARA